jgi:pimeloyl-ACP methyl ester carboxylesterase
VTTTHIAGTGVELAIHELGGPDDRGAGEEVLIVAHANGFLGQVYRAFAECLTDRVRVVALDFRAHGDSTTPSTRAEFDWSLMADDLTRVVAHIDVPVVHAFGHSMGGAAILEVERLAPGTFASAWLFEPIIPGDEVSFTGDSPLETGARIRRPGFGSFAEALTRYAAKPPLGLFRADVLHDYVTHGFHEAADGSLTLKCLPESEATTFGMTGGIRAEAMSTVDVRTVVAASGDGGIPAAIAPPLVNAMPKATLMEFPFLTHFGPLQEPVSVAAAVRRHIDGF